MPGNSWFEFKSCTNTVMVKWQLPSFTGGGAKYAKIGLTALLVIQ
jgi:hypothetical protein